MSQHIFSNYEKFLEEDAIYLTRLTNLKNLAILVSEVQERSEKPLRDVVKSVIMNKVQVLNVYPFIDSAFRQIEKDYA